RPSYTTLRRPRRVCLSPYTTLFRSSETMKILQVVGYKDTGKTTLIVEFLKILKVLNLKAAVIKHHHVDIDDTTDTGKFSRYSDYTIMNTPNYIIQHEHR